MIKRGDDGIWVVLRETIAMHHEEVFAMLTTEPGLIRWFPVAATVDLRSGGSIVLGWNERMTRTTTVRILEYDPGGRVVWDWHANRTIEVHAPVHWHVEPVVEEGTRVTLRQGPFEATNPEALLAMAEEAESWRWQLCNLRTVLEVKHDMRKVRPL